ncbi:hypothetical protein GCM10010398_35290 [Streptomyces fimbriatus]
MHHLHSTALGHRGGLCFRPVLRRAGRTPGRAAGHDRSILRAGTEHGRLPLSPGSTRSDPWARGTVGTAASHMSKKHDIWHKPDVTTATGTTRCGTATATT